MSAGKLLHECKAAGINVRLVNGIVKVLGDRKAVEKMTPVLRNRKAEIHEYLLRTERLQSEAECERLLRQLEPFMLHTVEEDADDIADVTRVNNIAMRLVSVNGWHFEPAMKAAAEWVVSRPPHPDEATFQDALMLWKQLKEDSH